MIAADEDKCIECCTCMTACPIGAIKQDKEHKKMIKYEFCQGGKAPTCVADRTNEALSCYDRMANEVTEDSLPCLINLRIFRTYYLLQH
jgi:Fe-S-cluster-containing hydrogenase component 2